MTQKTLADLTDVDQTTVHRYETGVFRVPLQFLERSAEAMKCDVATLMRDEETTQGNAA